jgi:hypothetical protein
MTINSLKNFGGFHVSDDDFAPIKGNKFAVDFDNFGDGVVTRTANNFGRFVNSISLPAISFRVQARCKGTAMIDTAEDPTWGPANMMLIDDVQGLMMRQVLLQIQKQKRDPLEALFKFNVRLFDREQEIRRYMYTGCSIGYGAHERDLSRDEPFRIDYNMQVHVNTIEMFDGQMNSLTKTWIVGDLDDEDDEDVLYQPIKR